MEEGDSVFQEAIQFLKSLSPLEPLEWDENLAKSAKEHVDDIGPKGLLLYQSSDGTEPEDRITKYGNYIDSSGENIDFGPNDALRVIVSLTLDDGEEERPHRENFFSKDYKKVGIACGPHKTEFYMCVMDFVDDFIPKQSQIQSGKTYQTAPVSNCPNTNIPQQNVLIGEKIQPNLTHVNNINNISKDLKIQENNFEIQNQLISEKNKNEILNKKILELEEKNRNLEKNLNDLKQENIKLKETLKNNLNSNNNINNIEITKAFLEKDKIIKELKEKLKRYPFQLNEGEQLISLIIYLPDRTKCSMICKNTEKFHKIEERIYEKFERYSETENYFLVNGRKVNRFNSLKGNTIKDGDIITMKIFENNEYKEKKK